jgi:A/G-specific adenine glycosylase
VSDPVAPIATRPPGVDDPAVVSVLRWWDAERRDLPWRSSRDDYAIWVAETMSQQTSVRRAAERWEDWMARWPTVHALAAATLAEVLELWDGLGYPRRARDLHTGARHVVAHGWPSDLRTLPGVGPYTDAAIRCFAREEPVLPPDVNVRRVLARRFPAGVDIAGDAWRAGSALMEFGQRICIARRPACGECPARVGCEAAGAGETTADPAPRARRQAPYTGSLREARGTLLRAVLADGGGDLPADGRAREAADGLVADGLLRRRGERLLPPR